MIRSLRTQLLLGSILGTTIVFLLFGFVLHHILRENIDAEFDGNLLKRARTIGNYVEFERGSLEFEWAHYDPQITMQPTSMDGDGYLFRIWTADGKLFAKPTVFEAFDLPPPSAENAEPVFGFTTLPDGSQARTVSFWFEAIAEDDEPAPQSLPMLGITVARRTTFIDSLMNRAKMLLASITVIALIISASGIAVLIHWSLRPLQPVIRQLQGLGIGDLSRRVDASGLPHELVPLISTINHLIADLEIKVARERRFVADAAHELRNPISAVRANLEAGLLDRVTDESRAEALQFCLDATARLQTVCERLLSLAGLQKKHIDIEIQNVDIVDLIESSLIELESSIESRGISFEWDRKDNACAQTDPILLCVILSNLLRNTIAYADLRDSARISMQVDNGFVQLTIRNTIVPDNELDPLKAVEPFWRADKSRTMSEGHAGLGLTIAKAASERLHGHLTCRLTNGGNVFVVELLLPVIWPVNASKKDHC